MEKKEKICDVCNDRVAKDVCAICKKDLCLDCINGQNFELALSLDRNPNSSIYGAIGMSSSLIPQSQALSQSPFSYNHNRVQVTTLNMILCKSCEHKIFQHYPNAFQEIMFNQDNKDKLIKRLKDLVVLENLREGGDKK